MLICITLTGIWFRVVVMIAPMAAQQLFEALNIKKQLHLNWILLDLQRSILKGLNVVHLTMCKCDTDVDLKISFLGSLFF